jgi:hypothetical protein
MVGQAMSESGFWAATASEKSLPSAISAMARRALRVLPETDFDGSTDARTTWRHLHQAQLSL